MASTKFDLRTEATRPLYAYVGLTDRAVEVLRGGIATGQRRIADVQDEVQSIDLDPQALREQASTLVSDGVDTLSKEARTRREAVEARVAELQRNAQAVPQRVQSLLADHDLTYTQLVTRGETLVTRIRRQRSTQEAKSNAKTTQSKAKTTSTQGKKAASTTKSTASSAARSAATTTKRTAKKQSTRPKSSAKATGTAAKKTASSAAKATKQAAQKVGD